MSLDRSKAYTAAGVDIHAGNLLVKKIKSLVEQTHTTGTLSDIGGFGGLFKPDLNNLKEPVLVASTDGVGTKLKLAFQFNKHDTIGIDLVAMSVNDILVQGAKPLLFLDYFATSKLNVHTAAEVIAGIAVGCKRSGCVLLGGETAEMPDMYAPGEYDLAGFCVGIVDNEHIVDGSGIKGGDSIIGFASSGIHSNGFSLVRKILTKSGLGGDDFLPGTKNKIADVLLEPTYIYVDPIRNLLKNFEIKGMVHITGGGFYHNIPRILPTGVIANINFGSWSIPPVFHWLLNEGELSWPEILEIFNCGIGYIIIVPAEQENDVLNRLRGLQQKAWTLGHIQLRNNNQQEQVQINF